jgi:anaerobic selenocysteine-containing dehydrogenase
MGISEHYRICPICEAGCGLKVRSEDRNVIAIEPNRDDVFSGGHMCAKGVSMMELDADLDRLRLPLIKENGKFREGSWPEAYGIINRNLGRIRDAYSANSIAIYAGNPTAHHVGLSMGLGVLATSLGSSSFYSASSVDQLPKQLACELMFGDGMAIPVPDIGRCDYLFMLGANPVVSNGSLWMVPKFRDKLRALQARGGQLVTVDPRKSETARLANSHYPIKPGTDAWLLLAIIHELIDQGCEIPQRYNAKGVDQFVCYLDGFDLRLAEAHTGISIQAITQIAAELLAAKNPVVYGRIGTTLQAFGTLTSYLVEVINIFLGVLDKAGGAMFPEQPFGEPSALKTDYEYNRFQSRVSHFPEVLGQMPSIALPEEIMTPGEGQIRALVCFAGNPVLSDPDSDKVKIALESLEFLVAIDLYDNETSQLADVILPGTSPFEDSHYDKFLGSMGYRNSARYSPAIFETEGSNEWEMSLTLAFGLNHGRVSSKHELDQFEDEIVAAYAATYIADKTSSLFERDLQEIVGMISPDSGVERLLDLGVRAGRWGDGFGKTVGLTLQKIIDAPDGIDLGELRANRLSEINPMAEKTIDLAPKVIIADIERLFAEEVKTGFQLIGRRNVQTNNSWLRNLPMLNKGKPLCVLEINTADARALKLNNGSLVRLASEVAHVEVVVELSDRISKGVVSLPHGFNENEDILQGVTSPSVNYNRLASGSGIDVPTATPALNGITVTLTAIA